MKDISLDDAASVVAYDPITGKFTWVKNGKSAGCYSASARYGRLWIFGRAIYAHRLAWLFISGEWPHDQIDHINGNGRDNRAVNLRCVNQFENCRNKPLPKSNRSGVIGVHWSGKYSRWCAQISDGSALKHLGMFSNLEDASLARKNAEELLGYHPNHGRAA